MLIDTSVFMVKVTEPLVIHVIHKGAPTCLLVRGKSSLFRAAPDLNGV